MRKSPSYIAAHICRVLKDGGSAPHSAEVQWFFKEQIKSRGWYTDELRRVAVRVRRSILREAPLSFLVAVADRLFRGRILEEKVFAVFLLEKSVAQFGSCEFHLFSSWLDRVSSWADHDALASFLLGPILVHHPECVRCVATWAKSPHRWRRRAAAVALIRGIRKGVFRREMAQVCRELLNEEDDLVQKGLGWLLREAVKANPHRMIPFLLRIRRRAPRLVLRTACETLSSVDRSRILE